MTRRLGLLAAVCVMLSWWLAWPATSAAAGASSGQLVADGLVVTLPADESVPSTAATLPPLAGLAFWAPVVRSAVSGSFATSEGGYVAPPGDVLVFVAVDSQVFAPPFGSIDRGVSPPSLALGVGGTAVSLPLEPSGLVSPVAGSTNGDQGSEADGRWLVAMPAGSDPVLTASESGFSQAVRVVSADRVGAAPAVLYRDGSGPLGLDVRPSLSGQLSLQTSGGPVMLPVTVSEAVLSYFRLDERAGPPSGLPEHQAYLLVQVAVGSGNDPGGKRVVLAGGAAASLVAATPSGGGATGSVVAPTPLSPGDRLNGVFGVVVPASVTSLTLTVGAAPSTEVAVETAQSVTAQDEPATVTGAAQFPLRFPVPSPLPPATSSGAPTGSALASASTVPSAVPAAAEKALRPAVSRGGEGGTLLAERSAAAGAAGAVVVVVGVVVWRRKTVLIAPSPVGTEAVPGVPSRPGPPAGGHDGALPADFPPPASTAGSELVEEGEPPPGDDCFRSESLVVGAELVIRVLGPLEVEGTTGPIRRRAVLRALVALALSHPRPVSGETLRGLLASSDDAELSATTLRSELSRLRAVLPDGMLPDRSAGSGYALAGRVEIDWARFQSHAARARSVDGADRVGEGLEALRLVRGRVLESAGWHGIDRTVWDIEAAIDGLGAEVATVALERGLAAQAAEATALAHRAVPGSPALWRLRSRAAEAGSGEHPGVIAARGKAETGLEVTDPG